MITRRHLVSTAALGVAAALTGCTAPAGTTPSPTAPAGSAADGAGFPAVVTTAFGDITIASAPQRVVALGWGDAEATLALGLQPVGASDWLQFGEAAQGVGPWAQGLYTTPPELIATLEPSYEAIAALAPDLILDVKSSGDQARYDLLSQITTTVGVPPDGKSYLVTMAEQMRMISTALGRRDEGDRLLAEVDAAFAAVTAEHSEWKGRTVAAATRTSEGWGAYVAGSERVGFLERLGFVQSPTIAELPTNAGGFSVDISAEQVGLLDADLIVAFPIFIEATQITEDPLWKRIPAVADGRAVVLGGELSQAYSMGGVASTRYAIDKVVPLIVDALA